MHEASEAFDVADSQTAVVQVELAVEHGGERRVGADGVAEVLEEARADEVRLCPEADATWVSQPAASASPSGHAAEDEFLKRVSARASAIPYRRARGNRVGRIVIML